ncbi:AMP-binding protein [Streptomyces sp. NPDC002499]
MISVRSFGASSAHEGLWRAQNMFPDSLNHALTLWDVDGELDAPVMERAVLRVLDEAEVLRITFADDGAGLRLVPREPGEWRPFFLDVSAQDDPQRAAREALADVLRQPFDLARDLLLRLGVVKLAPDRSLLVIVYHHLVSDGYGVSGLLSRRLAEVYTALSQGSDVPQLPHPWDAQSSADQAAAYRASRQSAEDREFWRDYLVDAPAPARVPRVALPDAVRAALEEPANDADRWGELAEPLGMVSRTLAVARADADAWTEAAKSMGVWLSSMLTAATAVFLRHRCDRPEFLLSLAVGNRVGAASRTPALAVNVVPVRVKVPLGATFAEITDAIGEQTYEIFDHTACHYSEIQRASNTVLGDRGSFGAVVNVVDFPQQLSFAGRPARFLAGTTGTFEELAIGVYTDGSADSDLYLRLDAPASLYSRAELRFLGEDLIAYIQAAVAAGDRPVGALDVVRGAERDRLLAPPAGTDAPPRGLTVAQLFARQVERAPDAVAVVSAHAAVTYRELDERSGHLARALQRHDVGPESVVAVALPRSVDLVVALLAVVKAGGAYLPVDPALRAQRIASVSGDAPVRALLTDPATAAAWPGTPDVPVLLLDDLRSQAGHDDAGTAGPVPSHPDSLLALTYGRGPAGTATGPALTHRNMERFVLDRREDGHGTVLWHAPHTADTLPLDVWSPLLNGGRVVVAPAGELDAGTLTALRQTHGITRTWLPASLFSAIAAHRPEALAGLREVWTGGERVSAAALRRVREACPGLTVLSGHGTAQTTVSAVSAVSHRPAAHGPEHPAGPPGQPAGRTVFYVLGPGLAPVPVGVSGELYVAGPGVARGYPGRPGPTAQRFLPCPFGPAGERMYRTGERVRWVAEGRLAYLGRAGAPIEVRGVPVEPAEVEEVLSEHPGLAQAVVDVRNDAVGQRRLVAFVVPAAGRGPRGGPSAGDLRRFAAERLAEVMVPSAFVVLEHLPVTAGGRVERTALPEPAFDDEHYRPPRNRTERVLAEAFADVLELGRVVGIDEDFFDLGGNSLRAIKLVGLIRAGLHQEVSIRTLFAARTVAGLSDLWKDLAQSSRPALRRRTKDGELLL